MHIFIDTSTLASSKFRLDWPPLRAVLDQVREGAIVLHTTEVTLCEIQEVALRKMRDVIGKVKESANYLEGISIVTGDGHSDYEREYEAKVLKMVSEFKSACRYIHKGDGADCSELIARFVGRRPPFSKGKPDEFKDALTALSMRVWIDAQNIGGRTPPVSISVVSDDSDWDAICQDMPGFRKTNLGTIMARIEELHEGILVALSTEMVLGALKCCDFEGQLAAHILQLKMCLSTDLCLTIEDATIDAVDFQVDAIKVLSVSEISATVQFSAFAVIDWREIDGESFEEEIRGAAEVHITPDGRVRHIHIASVDSWLPFGDTDCFLDPS